MAGKVPEADWNVFRELRKVALERFCQRVLEKLDGFRGDRSGTYHERYLALYRWLQDRDDEIARAFNDPRRSTMLTQLGMIVALGLLEPEELARFSASIRETVEQISKIGLR